MKDLRVQVASELERMRVFPGPRALCGDEDSRCQGAGGGVGRRTAGVRVQQEVLSAVGVPLQVSSEGSPDSLSDAQSFTVSVLDQTPGHPQLAPSCDLQITVRTGTLRCQVLCLCVDLLNVCVCSPRPWRTV